LYLGNKEQERMNNSSIGISGFSAYVPPYRVRLEQWCEWTGNSWDKARSVIGHAFRVAGPEQSVYTMAANAVLKLILDHGVDPKRVGYIAIGTESGTDNATSGALIVRGLVDEALKARGLPALARDCEVPEFKQACLGAVYGIKGAWRFLAADGSDRAAIVIASDIAEYARGSTGEPTQGAGAVAMLLERNPKLLEIDLRAAGSASSYRALDFRKPFLRFCGQTPGRDGRPRDFPVFNGKYSTACYIDEVLSALDAMFAKRSSSRAGYFRELAAVFMHRPYHRMPVASWTLGYLFALGADGGRGHEELAQYCAAAKIELPNVLAEMKSSPDLLPRALAGELVDEPYPLTALLMKVFKETPTYKQIVEDKMKLGAAVTVELGNLYSAALPGWLGAGLEEAACNNVKLDGRDLLLVGYGSGDASDALPARVVAGWQSAALKLDMQGVLAGAVDLTRDQYEALHDGREAPGLTPAGRGFVISRIGECNDSRFQDLGVEYYAYIA
jgi:hydroxymethylglutaryl-CoA synthase